MTAVSRSVSGTIRYTSDEAARRGDDRGRESFRIDIHADGSRTIAAHGEIDDAPAVVRDVSLRLDAAGKPQDAFVRLAVDGAFVGAGWFLFGAHAAECEAYTAATGRVRQSMAVGRPVPAFGSHAMVNDGFLMSLYDLAQGPGTQVTERLLLSSPDHRGATGPMLFAVDLAIEYVGSEELEIAAGKFSALHFRMVDVPGLPVAYPDYDLWVTADGDYVLLKAQVGAPMLTAYELVQYNCEER